LAHTRNHKLEKSDDHYTPKWLFDGLGLEFDIDVCAPTGGVEWIPAKRSFDLEANGLAQLWSGKVWMNPPFSKPSPWVEKFIANANGIALMVVSRSQWFQDIWQASDAVMPTPRTMKFERPDGHSKQISFQTFLFAIGEDNVKALERLNTNRVR
jgi:hypothetical protein